MNTKSNTFFHNFILCGIAGWCIEILFTAFHSLKRREMLLKGTTSLWMFPIYGSMAVLQPFFIRMKQLALPVRGCIYACMIFAGEFISGSFLRKYSLCPWDYSRHRWHVDGIIRLDFFPCWFATGLLYEALLTGADSRHDR